MDNPIGQKAPDLSLREAARYLGCAPQTMLNICNRKEITHRRIGNRIKIAVLDLDLYRAEHTVEADKGRGA